MSPSRNNHKANGEGRPLSALSSLHSQGLPSGDHRAHRSSEAPRSCWGTIRKTSFPRLICIRIALHLHIVEPALVGAGNDFPKLFSVPESHHCCFSVPRGAIRRLYSTNREQIAILEIHFPAAGELTLLGLLRVHAEPEFPGGAQGDAAAPRTWGWALSQR